MWIKRLKEEQLALFIKIIKLEQFIAESNCFDVSKEQLELLKEQLPAMRKYNKILEKRIHILDEDKNEKNK